MTFPWMQSRYTDKAIVCAVCRQWISQGEPRMYHQQQRVSAHVACVGAQDMRDHYTPEQPPVEASPERESREEANERMHAEKMAAYAKIADEIFELRRAVHDQGEGVQLEIKGLRATLHGLFSKGAS